ncbi:ATP-dependent DNA helicase [Variovorax sp. PAMC 28711]|uniref:ATP-dependent DNA helicase n=1 Tax=Variovorax sp. PAMC 28711 TaxID=1795631 RepID=UPI00078CE695|nr:ATP-dependent DNA helicase [Variovorax sp. PAMC 28711]AMM25978.1 ATP-dependent DNA helicase [Variovorax sp. PAMC 28711]
MTPGFEWTVSVKALCAFGAKAGDLDLRFVPAPSAQEGVAGHSLVQSRREDDYQSEVSLQTIFEGLRVRGRADGYHPKRHRVEEIKTFRGDFERIKGNHRALHWAQAKTYGAMLCDLHGLPALMVALVYLDLDSGEETVLEEHCTREALREGFEALCGRFALWARQEARHRAALASAFDALGFPHAGGFRAGQRELAEGVFRAAASRRCLVAQAPTGIGKTVATIFPLLKGWTARQTDKIFFLTAKTSGRGVALESLRVLGEGCASLRVVELVAREKVCEYPGRACNGDACPLAQGFYDRLPVARQHAVERSWLGREAIREVALANAVCPYFLAQEMVRWSDVVVADYNYYFDGSAMLYALTKDEDWKVAVLVDEAHNLLERARGMYSAELDEAALDAARRVAPGTLRRVIGHLHREWRAVQALQTAPYVPANAVPEAFQRALQDTVAVLAEHFAAFPDAAHGPLQAFFFDVLHFSRLSDSFANHSVFESRVGEEGKDHLAIRNLIPATFLRPRFEASMSTVCFSGTIAPFRFYCDALGLPENTVGLEVGSPFRTQQLRVQVAMNVSTRWRDRAGSLDRITDIIGAQFAERPGNYLAFFSSFDYLDAARDALARRHPNVPVWTQSRGMREPEREAFVARFAAEGQGVGFAVLGGAFGEGIDLPGDQLIGAFVASLGLPQHNEMNEVMRERMDATFGQGYEYTYLYPGLRKVVQAAGRVIRTEADAGVLHLLDDRFARPEIRSLLPPWWHLQLAGEKTSGAAA